MEENNYWFKAKRYGYGWYPCSWQGWLVILAWLVVLGLLTYNSISQKLSDQDMLVTFVPQVLISIAVLTAIAWKTGEPARWRWGKEKRN